MAIIEGNALKALALDLASLHDLPPSVLSVASTVTEANFSFNAIGGETLDALAPFTKLEVLVLDNNELSSLRELPTLPALKTLWLNNNALDDLEEVLNVLSRQCPQLEYLSLLRNPCCPNELIGKQETEYRRYRLYTKFRLPMLKNLDAGRFTDAEATEAREKGKFLRAVAQKSAMDGVPQPPSSSLAPGQVGFADEEDLFEAHSSSKKLQRSFASTPSFSGGQATSKGSGNQECRGSVVLDFSGRTNALCAALLEETEDADGAEGALCAPSGRGIAASTPSSATVFSEQKVLPSTALCVGNRFITDDVL